MIARLIVCEKTGQWAAALRWACGAATIPHDALRLDELRSLIDCRPELVRQPSGFLVLEATLASLEGVLRLLLEIRANYPAARAAVVGSRDLVRWEDVLREAGALHVAFSPRRLDIVLRLAQRHLAAAPQSPTPPRDGIWARLPWGND